MAEMLFCFKVFVFRSVLNRTNCQITEIGDITLMQRPLGFVGRFLRKRVIPTMHLQQMSDAELSGQLDAIANLYNIAAVKWIDKSKTLERCIGNLLSRHMHVSL